MARAPWYVAAGRWLSGIGAKSRLDPRTGVEQIRLGDKWWSAEYGTRKVRERLSDVHPRPPRRQPEAIGVRSAPIGVGSAIGVGQRIGTTTGTAAYTSEMSSRESFMPIGLGGDIRGESEKATRGGSRGGSSSGS